MRLPFFSGASTIKRLKREIFQLVLGTDTLGELAIVRARP